MIESDFTCDVKSEGVRVEDSIAYNWAIKVKNKVPNAHLLFQERSRSSGRVDFYLNGFADCAIEVLLNANKSGSSQDIDKHLEIFTSGQYTWKNYVLFNFAVSKDRVLPSDSAYHDIVYTYECKSNALYRGNTVISAPAVHRLPCPKPLPQLGQKRSYSSYREIKSTMTFLFKFVTSRLA
jgi:hypothetical protein